MGYNPNRHHRRSIRLYNYNYANTGAYFVTICCKNRKCLFGKIIAGKMILNECGKIAYNEWVATPMHRNYIKLHEFVVMPNHFHGIVEIVALDVGGGDVERRGVARYAPTRMDTYTNTRTDIGTGMNTGNVMSDISPKCKTLSTVIRAYKSAVTKQICNYWNPNTQPIIHHASHAHNVHESIWQRNYHEHIIRNDTEYIRIAKYIKNNPVLWAKDCFY